MRKRNGFALAILLVLLVTGCKPDATPTQPAETPAGDSESLAKTGNEADSVTPDVPLEHPGKAPVEAGEGLADTPSEVDLSARDAATRFLKALKNIDTPEGKKTLAETRWRKTMKAPRYVEFNVVSEEMFSTDIPGVKGYKQEVMLGIPREGSKPFVKRYMLIAYEDTKKKAWKVFDFTQAWDMEQEIEKACDEKALGEGETTARQGRLIRCSYWLMMSGRTEPAEEKAKEVNKLHAEHPDPDDEAESYRKRADATIHMITRMSGAQL
jgi:hypothetical protein